MRAVLWDLDGTLADSRAYHWRAWRDVLHAEGVEISYEQFLATFGQRNDAILGRWLGAEDPERTRRLGEAKEARFRELVRSEGLVPLAGALEWVWHLDQAGWRQAIASSAPRQNVAVMVSALGLDEQLDALVTAEDVTTGKPDPEVFLTAAARLAVPPVACVVVEDAAAGIEAARRAGMRSIGVGTVGADVSVSSLAELPLDTFERLVTPR